MYKQYTYIKTDEVALNLMFRVIYCGEKEHTNLAPSNFLFSNHRRTYLRQTSISRTTYELTSVKLPFSRTTDELKSIKLPFPEPQTNLRPPNFIFSDHRRTYLRQTSFFPNQAVNNESWYA